MVGNAQRVVAAEAPPDEGFEKRRAWQEEESVWLPGQEPPCPHVLTRHGLQWWTPTTDELNRMLARHRGWLQKENRFDLQARDGYLEFHDFPEWRSEALKNPEKANFCNAKLVGVALGDAILIGANLNNADLSDGSLDGADLRGAALSGAKLRHTNLRRANMDGVDLTEADLSNALLSDAILSNADFSFATLPDTELSNANLSKAHLNGANLHNANLYRATLSDAKLSNANLRGANLNKAQVNKAKLDHADLTGATYAPVSEPPDPYVTGINGLATLDAAEGDTIGLVQLRKLLKEAGLGDGEKEVTFSIQRNLTRNQLSSRFTSVAWIEGILRRVGFDWTTAYGLFPERALIEVLLLGIILTPVYTLCILRPTQKGQVVRVFPENSVDASAGDSTSGDERKKVIKSTVWWRTLGWGAYFSLLSAVNIGFEQFTPGDWVRRLQAREYSLQAVGWVRSVAGAQALLSVYLLAMWVLTQFGQPFG